MIVHAAGASLELVTVADERLPAELGVTGTHQQHLLVSPAKAMAVLGWTPTPWRDAVRDSVEWHLANPPTVEPDLSADDSALDAL